MKTLTSAGEQMRADLYASLQRWALVADHPELVKLACAVNASGAFEDDPVDLGDADKVRALLAGWIADDPLCVMRYWLRVFPGLVHA